MLYDCSNRFSVLAAAHLDAAPVCNSADVENLEAARVAVMQFGVVRLILDDRLPRVDDSRSGLPGDSLSRRTIEPARNKDRSILIPENNTGAVGILSCQ